MPETIHEADITIDPIALLQDKLGIDETQAQDLASIEVACPVPGKGRGSLGEFMTSEHGADKAMAIVDVAVEALEEGKTPEEAMARALGWTAVKDRDTGKLARVPIESKKK